MSGNGNGSLVSSQGDEEDESHFHGGSYRSLFSLLRHDTEDTPTGYFWMVFCACVHLREESSIDKLIFK